ncbi:hypothetical protein F4813DRAFT_355079 [Daldinia decipiens]|uniref:uncharacterized protein n=1 Tax=Daldinia decipiens TaxID=326647 RepID=UPI0020C45247|nr:uncharacterized protein F4813DRAFT_355079 [Daldinia decipiens]KAI1658900.1 hypothetical protein F4813DRAFT_355079 [Daldinia decipiens]
MSEQGRRVRTFFNRLRKRVEPRESVGSPSTGPLESSEPASVIQNDLRDMESYGLFEFPPRSGQPRFTSFSPDAKLVDIIAVHGLGGSWRSTWSSGNGEDPAIWLRDRLPEVLARINVRPRIRAFGYDASFVFTSSTSDLDSRAQDLLTRIRITRQTEDEMQAPIIFIAHSLGGLIVKLAINIAHTDNEYYQDILRKTAGCLFLAVPFHGADAASWAVLGSRIASALSLGMAGNSGIPSALERNSKDWMKISRDFVQRGKNMVFRSAYETEKMGRSVVVDEASVRNNVPNERVFPMPGSNHRTICKFGDYENERFTPISLAITELAQAVLITRSEPELPIISELPISTPTFYGRNTELEALFDVLDPTIPGRNGAVIFGIGGSGKTQLILKYIKDKKQLYSAVIWINASTSEQLTQSFTDAFDMISNSWTHKDRSNPYLGENKRDFVLTRLRSTLKRKWLLVIDSADDPNNLNLTQLLPDCNYGAIIVTSTRRDAWDILEPYGFEGLELDKLGDADGTKLLLDRARIPVPLHGSSDAIAIVRELGGLPLAIEQAGILLRRRVVGLENFIKEYHTQYKELMGHLPRAGEVQHDKARSMYTILSILYSNVKTESPIAATILRLLAVIGPTQVPISIFLNVFQFDSEITTANIELRSIQNSSKSITTFRLHMTLLEDLCLVKIKPASREYLESVLLHQAVCQWITKSPSECEPRWIIFVALGLGNVLCRGEGSLDWPMGGTTSDSYISRICLSWIDRIDFLIRDSIDSFTIEPPHGIFVAEYANIACNFGYIYFCNSRYEEARVFLSCALGYYPFISATHDSFSGGILRLYYCLAVSHYETGNLVKAEKFINAAYNISQRETTEFAKIISLQQSILDRTTIYHYHHQPSTAISTHRETIKRGKQPVRNEAVVHDVQSHEVSQKDERQKADTTNRRPDASPTTSLLRAAAATFDDAINKGCRVLDPLRSFQGVGGLEWEAHRLISLHLPARVKAHIVKRATISSLENNTTTTKEILLEDNFYRRILARSTEHLGI